MTDDRQATCEERIAGQMAGRAEDVRKVLAASNGETLCRYCGERITQEQVDDDEAEALGLLSSDVEHARWLNYVWTHDEDVMRRVCREGGNVLSGVDPIATPDEDYTEDSLHYFGLGISRKVVLRFDMSTGGPADWLEVVCEERRPENGYVYYGLTVETVVYHFADWFDHAEQVITDGPLFELAEWIAETQGGN